MKTEGSASPLSPGISSLSRTSAKWSFSKSSRFALTSDPTKNVIPPGQPSSFSSRATSMGFGGRTVYKPPATPAPGAYDPMLSRSSPVTTFPKNDSLPFFLRTAFASAKDIPGPGSYSVEKGFLFKKKGFLLKSRNEALDPFKNTPGPGQYEPSSKLVNRKLFVGVSFGSGKRTDFTTREGREVPGPGTYTLPKKQVLN